MLQISGIIAAILLIVLFIGLFYINRIATGTKQGTTPQGYRLIEANGYSFAVKLSGNEQDTPVILLHGFPESSRMWNKLMSELNQGGYYTIAPDQRGYSYTARPKEISKYQITHLTQDIIAIADQLGIDQFHLIGHDWGSVVGWKIATDFPERLYSYTALSVPHLTAFSRAYKEDKRQHEASKYIRNFQKPKIPEFMLAKNNYKLLKRIWFKHNAQEKAAYLTLFQQKHALSGAINWYRGNYYLFNQATDIGEVTIPVLYLWGNKDFALLRSGVEWTEEYVSGYYRFVELEAGHWLIQEAYETVRNEIVDHLAKFP